MTTSIASRRRRKIAAIVAGLSTLGIVGASAATLGGITPTNIGADVAVVSSCDTDGVTVSFTNAFDATLGAYKVTAVAVSGINTACNTKAIAVTVKDGNSPVVASASGTSTVAAGAASVSLSSGSVSSQAAAGVAIVISG